MKSLITTIAILAFFLVSCKQETYYSIPPSYSINTRVQPEDCGSIIVSPSSTTYDAGERLSLSATPKAGYRFAGWSGTISSLDNPVSIFVYRNHEIVANFEKILKPNLSGLDDYELVWHDEFDEDTIDEQIWSLILAQGQPNDDVKYSSSSKHLFESDGSLHITAAIEEGDQIPTSSIIISKKAWTKGYFEGRVRIPSGKGTWPAFWLAPFAADWPLSGEIDILEAVGFSPDYTHHNIWCSKYRNNEYMVDYYLPDAQDRYHIYAAEVTDEYVKIYVDNTNVLTYSNDGEGNIETWPYSKYAQKVIINLCWGGEWAGCEGLDFSCLPATMDVDYVRVFQRKP